MTPYLLVALGGSLGAMARFAIGREISSRAKTAFPLGTYVINLAGAFLFGLLHRSGVEGNAYLLLGDGFFGAFTTFSTFLYEGFQLYREKQRRDVLSYFAGTVILGIAGYAIGAGLR